MDACDFRNSCTYTHRHMVGGMARSCVLAAAWPRAIAIIATSATNTAIAATLIAPRATAGIGTASNGCRPAFISQPQHLPPLVQPCGLVWSARAIGANRGQELNRRSGRATESAN
jgi:hypothetical protein